jgi:ribonucleotide reductase beta subunit family protein with ferritin-like domain
LFQRILELIYQPDIDTDCKKNMLELFKFLVQESDKYREYVYQIIKNFSEKSHKRFLSTNIVHFMNDLARGRRTKLFGETSIPALSF